MSINKVIFGSDTVMDITDTTATSSDVLSGEVFYTAAGTRSTGTLVPVTSVNGETGDVELDKSDIGLGNVDNVQQYSASNPVPYPDLTDNPLIIRDDATGTQVNVNTLVVNGSVLAYQFLNSVYLTNLSTGNIQLDPGGIVYISNSDMSFVCHSGNYYFYALNTPPTTTTQWSGGYCLTSGDITTYTSMSVSEYQAGTGTTARVITPARLKGAIQYHSKVQSVNGETGDVTLSIPTATSDLTNDSGFITDAGVTSFNGSTGAVTYTAPVTSVNGSTGAVTLSIPTATSDLTNDSGFITDAGVTSFNGSTGAVTYTAPVTSVNGSTGAVTVSPNVVFCTCATASGTAAKDATIVSGTLTSLSTGDQVIVKFTYSNTVASPTLSVGSTDAKLIKRYGTTAPSTSSTTSWQAGSCIHFVYDGTYWQMCNWTNTNSTYSAITQANIENSSGTTAGLITGQRAAQAVSKFESVKDVTVGGTSVMNGTTAEVPSIPTATSDLTNDSGFITNNITGTFDASGNITTTGGNLSTWSDENNNGGNLNVENNVIIGGTTQLGNLESYGTIVLNSNSAIGDISYGDTLPSAGTVGRIFFLKV